MTDTFVTVHCRGCHRQIGVATNNYAVYCSPFCADQPTASAEEERDSAIEWLTRSKGFTPTQIAVRFGLTRQRVHQILQERGVPRNYA